MKKNIFVILIPVCFMLNTGLNIQAQQARNPEFSAEELILIQPTERAFAQEEGRIMPSLPSNLPGNQTKNRITGAFGIKLGEQVPEELRGPDSKTTTDGKFLQFPVTPSVTIAPHLDAIYLVKVTPVEHRVFEIVATCRVEGNDTHLTAYELSEQFINILEKRYGKPQFGPTKKEREVISVTFAETSSNHSPRIEILTNNDQGLVTIVYQDPEIKEAGKTEYVEQKTGKLNPDAF